MVINITNSEELKNLINQAKDGKIPWDEKVKLESSIKIDKSLGSVSPESWEKIKRISPDWWQGEPSLASQIKQSNKLFNSDWKFVSKEKLAEFKKYVDINETLKTSNRGAIQIGEVNENDIVTASWNSVASVLKDSNKIFGRNGDDYAFQSKDSLLFLQSILSDESIQIIEYQAGGEFKLSELKSYTLTLTWKEYEELLEKRRLLENKIKQLLGLKETDELPTNWNELLAKKSDLEQTKKDLETKLEEINKKLDNQELVELEQKRQELEAYVVMLEENYQEAQEEIRGLEAETEQLNQKITELKIVEPAMGELTEAEKLTVQSEPFAFIVWKKEGGYHLRDDMNEWSAQILAKITNWRKEKLEYLLKAWPVGDWKEDWEKSAYWQPVQTYLKKLKESVEQKINEITQQQAQIQVDPK